MICRMIGCDYPIWNGAAYCPRHAMPRYFRLISADVAWPYEVWSEKGKGRNAENWYPTMTWDDIRRIPIAELADPRGAFLLLWTTPPGLMQQLDVAVNHWGATYITKAFSWVKLIQGEGEGRMSNGYYTRSNTEDVYLLRFGQMPAPEDRAIRQVIIDPQVFGQRDLFEPILQPMTTHSTKPKAFFERANRLLPFGHRIELFARGRYPGWYQTGFDVDGLDICEFIQHVQSGTYQPGEPRGFQYQASSPVPDDETEPEHQAILL